MGSRRFESLAYVAALALFASCVAGGGGEPARSHTTGARLLLTTTDYHASGARGVEAFLDRDEDGPALRAVLERVAPAVVEVRGYRKSTVDSRVEHAVLGSGVVLAGGRWVVTAGHNTAGDEALRWEVRLGDGRRRAARCVASGYPGADGNEDWAVFELADPFTDVPGIASLAPWTPGEPAVILGFPGTHVLDEHGRVIAVGPAYKGAHLPMTRIGRMREGESLEPLAGITDLAGGMSGGGVFDSRGELVGIFVATEQQIDGAGEITWRARASACAQFAAALQQLAWQSPDSVR